MIMDGGPCGMPDARHVPDIPRGGREEDKDHDSQIQPERGTTRVEGPPSIRAVHRFRIAHAQDFYSMRMGALRKKWQVVQLVRVMK
jgi:hypothetical protein